MNVDLSNVLAQAAKVTSESSENSSSQSGVKLVYPQNGVMKVRLIYNNLSQTVMRKIERHTVGDKKVPCLNQYGKECPVCKAIDNINNAKGTDLWKYKRTTRGIAYAEYIESDYKWDKPEYEPKKGEIVILMFPWTLYTDFNRLISSSGDKVYSLICSNVGMVFKVSRWVESNQTKYRAEIDPFDTSHQTCSTDEEYEKLVNELPSLNDKFVPIDLNEDIVKANREMADQLTRDYLSQDVVQPNVGSAGFNLASVASPLPPQVPQSYVDPNSGIKYNLVNNQWVPELPSAPQPAVSVPVQNTQPNDVPWSTAPKQSNNPECFGKHGSSDINYNTCLLCPKEISCKQFSGK